MGGGNAGNSFSSFGNDIIGQGNSFGSGDKFGTGTLGASEPKWEPYQPYESIHLSKPQVLTEVTFEREGMFDYMGNMKGAPQMLIPTPEQEVCNVNSECSGSGDTQGEGNGNTEQRTDSGDATNDGNSVGSEQGEGDNKEQKQQKKKPCVTTNQKLVFANAGYYDKDVIKRDILPAGNEQDRKVFKTYEDKRLASKASVIKTKDGVPSFNIAGTANPTEEGL